MPNFEMQYHDEEIKLETGQTGHITITGLQPDSLIHVTMEIGRGRLDVPETRSDAAGTFSFNWTPETNDWAVKLEAILADLSPVYIRPKPAKEEADDSAVKEAGDDEDPWAWLEADEPIDPEVAEAARTQRLAEINARAARARLKTARAERRARRLEADDEPVKEETDTASVTGIARRTVWIVGVSLVTGLILLILIAYGGNNEGRTVDTTDTLDCAAWKPVSNSRALATRCKGRDPTAVFDCRYDWNNRAPNGVYLFRCEPE
jgi:hypothetical protein